ncbi:MAG: transposase [Betaproteobacteria bacterium]|nr:MAG: transposase [Betaproteobacteria bacterium]
MGRHARLVMPEVALHIYQRGNNRQDCFRRRNDYLVYLAILRDLCGTRPCALHAYCLMTNHVHLLMTPQDAGVCARLMRDLSGCYASYFNRSYGRTGTLWEGRFGSCLVESALYVLGCYRYIELNPVRARMVPDAVAYDWSSARANVGLENSAELTPHPEYIALAEVQSARQRAYRTLLDLGDDPLVLTSLREAASGGYPLVGEPLKAQLTTRGARLERRRPGPRKAKLSE